VELAALVALRSSLGVLGLARAELSEVLGCLGGYVCEELHFDAAEGFPWYEFDVRWSGEDIVVQTSSPCHDQLTIFHGFFLFFPCNISATYLLG